MPTAIQRFLANQIVDRKLKYSEVVEIRPDLKDGVDLSLIKTGHKDLIEVS